MLEMRVLSPIEKVFPDSCPQSAQPFFEGMLNEVISFQIAWRRVDGEVPQRADLSLNVESEVSGCLHMRKVKHVPVRIAALNGWDDNYLNGGRPGLYPDPLTEIPPHALKMLPGTMGGELWSAVWCDFEPDGKLPAGDYDLRFAFTDADTGAVYAEKTVSIHLIDAVLPRQTLMHTKWLHTDCLANYYHVPVFSEEYWRITENYVRCAVRRGINMILTPIHTPTLDTRIGTYRPNVQLTDITYMDGVYTFGFERLHRWVEMCLRCGAEYFEIAHLFTQWGGKAAPQIWATTENGYERIFGWDTPADSEAYAAFLRAYLPAVYAELTAMGIADRCIFHISDEPGADHIEQYLADKQLAKSCIPEAQFYDALGDIALYRSGAVEHPIPGTDHIEPFLEADIPGLWAYYCIGQGHNVSNLFVGMPGARTRILGTQLYKYNIKGFLQWGFNFYNSILSDYPINPWFETDNDGFAPAGDAYQVYPGADGEPVESIRLMLVQQALQDMRALELLESLIGREKVLAMIDEGIEPLTFSRYPHDGAYLLGLRHRVNRAIEEALR